MKRYTFRYHLRGTVDITVEAKTEDDAWELAEEKYCRGDYEENPEYFENYCTELIHEE